MDELLKKEIPWLDKANYFMGLKKEASMRQNVGALMGSTLMGGLAYTRYKPDPKTGLSRAEKDALGQLKAHPAGVPPQDGKPEAPREELQPPGAGENAVCSPEASPWSQEAQTY